MSKELTEKLPGTKRRDIWAVGFHKETGPIFEACFENEELANQAYVIAQEENPGECGWSHWISKRSFYVRESDPAIVPDRLNEPDSDFILIHPSFWVEVDNVKLYVRHNENDVIVEAYPSGSDFEMASLIVNKNEAMLLEQDETYYDTAYEIGGHVGRVDPDRSVGCYYCGELFDERESVGTTTDGGSVCEKCGQTEEVIY